jgi:ABC-type transport system substrate-binding protein
MQLGVHAARRGTPLSTASFNSGTSVGLELRIRTYSNDADPDVSAPDAYATANIVPGPWTSAAGYSNPHVDELFSAASKTLDREQRARTYFEIQDILVHDVNRQPPRWSATS